MEAKVTINKVKHITLQIGRKGGIVVDQDLHIGSTNAVSTGAVVEALNQLDAKVTKNLSKLDTEVAEVNKKCDDIVIGYHPKMTVGFADNLVGRGDPSAEQFVYQPTANDLSVLDEPARIKQIKGNSIVWNQIVKPHLFSRDEIDNGLNGITVTENADGSYTLNGMNTADVFINLATETAFKVGEKVALIGTGKLYNFRFYLNGGYGSALQSDGILTCTDEGVDSKICFIHLLANTTLSNISINPKVCALTKAYGAGNEPATADEFLARIPKSVDMNAYNEGELISMKTEAVKTVGFNQWDEQWEIGRINVDTGAAEPKDNSIRSKNFIPVIPNTKYYVHRGSSSSEYFVFYDRDYNFIGNKYVGDNFTTPANCAYIKFRLGSAYGTVYKGDICINIWHSGYKNGTYEPYETFTRELGVIGKYFPGGMRKAGDVFDSIEWDGDKLIWKAVQRVGERAYASGDETNSAVTTDKVKTLYALTNPIVTEIAEGLNFDYKVWDFGTEEALSSVISAPFSADIIYGFNAVDNIRTLLERVRVLESKHP